ncbi:MAG: DUF4347 domain-containing protein, partial [Pseudomonadales bacterium]
MKKKSQSKSLPAAPVFEELEPRVLLSAGVEGFIAGDFNANGVTEFVVDDNLQLLSAANSQHSNKTAAEQRTLELIFMDAATPDREQLLDDLLTSEESANRRFEIIEITADRDGVLQVSETLNNYQDVDAVHIISHGSDGNINLGGSTLNASNLTAYQNAISGWSNALDANADILVYGCNLAANDAGQVLIDQLSILARADIAASTDLTGNVSLGGDWVMEYHQGQIDTQIAFSSALQQQWQGTLATVVVDTTDDYASSDARHGDTSSISALLADMGTDNLISLREAITAVNNTNNGALPDEIHFAIALNDAQHFYYQNDLAPGLSTIAVTTLNDASITDFDPDYPSAPFSWYSIALTQDLPTVTDAVVIDGTTQNGFVSAPVIELDGSNLTAGVGFQLSAGSSTLHGFTINGFPGNGVIVDSDNNLLVGNYIGTDASGTIDVGNGNKGVHISEVNNTVGGTNVGEGNMIAYNSTGISVSSGSNNAFLGNRIYSNTGLGIDLEGGSEDAHGVTANDADDSDTGANNLQNFPQLFAASTDGITTTITGQLDSAATTNYRIEFFSNGAGTEDSSAYGEGQTYLGFTSVTTDTSGYAAITASLGTVVIGDRITATASSAADGTSEFALNIAATSTQDRLWISTDSNVAPPGADGLLDGWAEGQVLNFAGPDLNLGPATDGDFSTAINFDLFTANAVDAGALHFVASNHTIGSGAGQFDVHAGDVLVSFNQDETILAAYAETAADMIVHKNDLLAFRPDTAGDYSSGTFYMLLDGVPDGTGTPISSLHGISLVEHDTVVGSTLLSAGSFIFAEQAGSTPNSVYHFSATTAGSVAASGTTITLIDGEDIGIDAANDSRIRGLALVSAPITIGGETLNAGEILVTLNFDDAAVGNAPSISAETHDIFVLSVSNAEPDGGTTTATARMLLDGSDVNLDGSERIYALAVVPGNVAPNIDLDDDNSSAISGNDYATTFDEATGAVLVTDSDAMVLDVNGSELSSLTVTIANLLDGSDEVLGANVSGTNISTNYVSATGVLTLTGADTVANYQQVLRTIFYNNLSDNPDTTDRMITFVANDGAINGSIATTTLTVVAENDEPQWGGLSGARNYVENDSGLFVQPTITITDADSSNLAGGTLMVHSVLGGTSNDVFQVTPGGNVTLSGSNVLVSGTIVGTFSGGAAGTDLVIIWNAQSTPVAAQEVARRITYSNTSDAPTTTTRVINFVLTDGDGGTSSSAQTQITPISVEDNPLALDDVAALDFDGVDDYVNLGSGVSLSVTNTLTMEAWVRPDALSANGALIINKEGEYEVGISPSGTLRWAFANSDPGWAWHDTGFEISLNSWTHIAVSIDNGTINSYINGNLVDSYYGSGAIGDAHPTLDDLRIGGRSNSPADQYFDGQIDEVRLWSTARSVAEIQSNLDTDVSGNAELLGYWRFNQGSDVTTADSSTNSNMGTLIDGGAGSIGPQWRGYSVAADSPLILLAAQGPTTNDFDVDGDTVSIVNVDTSSMLGSVIIGSNGSINYDPNGAFDFLRPSEVAYDTVTYTLEDANGMQDTATITIRIVGVNDAPAIADQSFIVAENSADGTLVGSVLASDPDTSDTLTYSITGGNAGGVFAIDSANGTIIVANSGALDFETASAFSLAVQVADNGVPILNNSATVTINLKDLNEFAISAIADSDANANAISEDAIAGTIVGVTALASDADGSAVVSYALDDDADGRFVIDSQSGVITVVGALDAATADSHTVVVRANSSDGSSITENFSIAIAALIDPLVPPQPNHAPLIDIIDNTGPPATLPDPTDETERATNNEPEAAEPELVTDEEIILDLRSSGTGTVNIIVEQVAADADYPTSATPPVTVGLATEPVPQKTVIAVDQILPQQNAKQHLPGRGLESFAVDEVLADHAIWAQLDQMKRDIEADDEALSEQELIVKVVTGSTLTLSAGCVSWLLRGGTLVASLLSTLPVWKGFDPLPILSAKRRKEEDERKKREQEE